MCKKIFLIMLVFSLFIITTNISALSTLDTQNIAREYTIDNEFIDSRVFNISCQENDFYVATVVNSKNEVIFFVPIDEDRNIYTKKDNVNEEIFKTTYFLREITKQSQDNFLSVTLIDAINNQITILQSKNAQLQGIINAEYSENITSASKTTQSNLSQLIELLTLLKDSLDEARKAQQSFVNSPSCSQRNGVVLVLRDAFNGYNDLTLYGLNYQNSVNSIIEVIVAEPDVDENTKMIIQGYVSTPRDLSRDISNIQDRLSSTQAFYSEIVSEILKSGDNNPAIIALNNFISRQDYVAVNKKMYGRDETLRNTLDNFVIGILDEYRYPYWKDRDTLEKLEINYQEINTLISRNRYSEALPKINLLKSQALKVEEEGFIDISDVQQGFDYYLLIVVIILIVFLFIVIKKKPKKKSLNKKEPSKKKEVLSSFNSKDPFK